MSLFLLALASAPARAAAPATPAPAPAAADLPARLTCVGTEPFWSVTLEGGKARVATPEKPEGSTASFTTTRATHGAAWLVTPKGKNAGFSWMTVRPDEATCS